MVNGIIDISAFLAGFGDPGALEGIQVMRGGRLLQIEVFFNVLSGHFVIGLQKLYDFNTLFVSQRSKEFYEIFVSDLQGSWLSPM